MTKIRRPSDLNEIFSYDVTNVDDMTGDCRDPLLLAVFRAAPAYQVSGEDMDMATGSTKTLV